MNLEEMEQEEAADRIPRVSGDEPSWQVQEECWIMYSPRERG